MAGSCTCQKASMRSDRLDQKCRHCQGEVKRQGKRARNNYKPHGPCQTDATRTWRRQGREKSK